MRKKLSLLLFAVLNFMGAFAAPVMPIVSTTASSTYYTISFGRQAAKCIQENGVATDLSQVALPSPVTTSTNAQKWKIVEVTPGSQTYYLVSKNGVCFKYNGAFFAGGASSDVFTFTPSTNASYQNSWTLLNGTTGVNDSGGAKVTLYNTAAVAGNAINFTFVETVVPDNLDIAFSAANLLYTTSKSGNNPGNYSTADRAVFQSAIAAAIAVKDASPAKTQAERDAAAVTLQNAYSAYSASKIQLKISAANSYYYYLKGTRGTSATALFATNKGIGNQILNSDITTLDAQLWKVVTSGAGIAIVNKLNGSYLDPSAIAGAAVNTTASMPTMELKTTVTGQDLTSGNDLFSITENIAIPTFTLKSGVNGGLINDVTDNMDFQFIVFDALQALTDAISVCEQLYNSLPAGTNPGMVAASDKQAFRNAIDAAIVYKTTGTDADKIAAGTILNTAKVAFENAPKATLKYSTPESAVWYAIKNPSRNNYMCDNGMNANITGVVFASGNNALLWKIVDLGNGTVNIVSKSNAGHITIPSVDSQNIPLTSTPQPWSLALLGNAQYNINGTNAGDRQLHMASGGNLVAYPGGIGTASTWMFEEISITTGVSQVQSAVSIIVNNRTINITGTAAKAEIYTISGIKVQQKSLLNPGVYVVKVNNTSYKVIVY